MPALGDLPKIVRASPDIFFFGGIDMGGILTHILSACTILLDAAMIFTLFFAFAKWKKKIKMAGRHYLATATPEIWRNGTHRFPLPWWPIFTIETYPE